MPKISQKTARFLFKIITVVLILIFPIVCYVGYLSIRKMVYSYNYCGAYGKLDAELGWKLKENASSCISLKNHITGKTYFDSNVYTNNMGFRDIKTNINVPKNAIAFVGSSFTFGYGLNYEETFPYLLSQKINFPVVNMGIPAYGSGSSLMLFENYVNQIQPSLVILYSGAWHWSLCFSKTRPTENLVPCFWWDDQKQQIELIKPQPGKVLKEAKKYSFPSGALSSGYDNLEYFFIIKPLMTLNSIKTKVMKIIWQALGFKEIGPSAYEINPSTISRKRIQLEDQSLPEHNKKYIPKPGDDEVFSKIDAVIEYTLRRYAKLAKKHNFILLVLDEMGAHKPYLENARKDFKVSIIHVGPREFKSEVTNPSLKLSKGSLRIEGDGHFTFKANQLVANMINNSLVKNSALPIIKPH